MNFKNRSQKIIMEVALLVLLMLVISCIFWFSNLDIYLEKIFFSTSEGWFLTDYWLFDWMYKYGPYPAFLSFILSIGLLLLSFFHSGLKKHRKFFIFIILFLFIGSGLIVNFIFKEHWGRPRPRDIIQFGGQYKFVHHWLFGPIDKNSSFSSGHASVAFFMIYPYFIYRRRKIFLTLIPGILYGLLMTISRMAQGGHFASDGVYSGLFMYLTGLLLYYFLRLDIAQNEPVLPSRPKDKE